MLKPLRIASYNIHKGMSPLNRRLQLPNMAESLQQLNADVLFLQEVQGRHGQRALRFADWPHEPQHHYLARRLQHRVAYGLNAHYAHGHHGNAILSRFPIQQWCNLDISVNRFESRGLLHCELQLPRWPVTVSALCVHLNLLARDRRKQFSALKDYIQRAVPADHALILAGDFNDWRGEACDHLSEDLGLQEIFHHLHGHYARSFPARFPLLSLDRIYVRGLVPHHAEVLRGAPWGALSDHLPLAAELLPAVIAPYAVAQQTYTH